MLDFRRIFARTARSESSHDPASDYHPSDKGGTGLEVEYQQIIADAFRRWGISPTCVTIEVKKIGQANAGFDVLVGMVRLNSWERTSAMRLLLGLPLLETKIRKTVRATWLADFSHFGGLWLHTSEQIQAPQELRDLITTLVPINSDPRNPDGTTDSGLPVSSPSPLEGRANGESVPLQG